MQLPPEKQVGRTPTQRLNRVRFWLQLWNRVWRRNTIVSRRTVGLAVATCVSWIPSESFKCWWHTHSDCFFRPPFLWLIKRLWLLWFHSFFFFPSKHDWSTIMLVFVRMRFPTGISKERRLCSPFTLTVVIVSGLFSHKDLWGFTSYCPSSLFQKTPHLSW